MRYPKHLLFLLGATRNNSLISVGQKTASYKNCLWSIYRMNTPRKTGRGCLLVWTPVNQLASKNYPIAPSCLCTYMFFFLPGKYFSPNPSRPQLLEELLLISYYSLQSFSVKPFLTHLQPHKSLVFSFFLQTPCACP